MGTELIKEIAREFPCTSVLVPVLTGAPQCVPFLFEDLVTRCAELEGGLPSAAGERTVCHPMVRIILAEYPWPERPLEALLELYRIAVEVASSLRRRGEKNISIGILPPWFLDKTRSDALVRGRIDALLDKLQAPARAVVARADE
ncbi:MAG: hypothetical protein Q8R13_00570 [bacterium]|nr:hypothetical protein [bacterium]